MQFIQYLFCFDGILSIRRRSLTHAQLEAELDESTMSNLDFQSLNPRKDWQNLVQGLHNGVKAYKESNG